MRIKKIMCKNHGTDPPDRERNEESLVAMNELLIIIDLCIGPY